MNLRVLTDHVRELAHQQQAASGRLRSARQAVAEGLADRVWATHGVVSAVMNMAVAKAETARKDAIENQYRLGLDLHERLNNAADNYENEDWVGGRNIGACGL